MVREYGHQLWQRILWKHPPNRLSQHQVSPVIYQNSVCKRPHQCHRPPNFGIFAGLMGKKCHFSVASIAVCLIPHKFNILFPFLPIHSFYPFFLLGCWSFSYQFAGAFYKWNLGNYYFVERKLQICFSVCCWCFVWVSLWFLPCGNCLMCARVFKAV